LEADKVKIERRQQELKEAIKRMRSSRGFVGGDGDPVADPVSKG